MFLAPRLERRRFRACSALHTDEISARRGRDETDPALLPSGFPPELPELTHPRPSAVILAALAAVLIVAGILADRLGASASVAAMLVLMLAVLSMAACGLSAGTMRVSTFQSGALAGTPALLVASLAVLGLGTAMALTVPDGLMRPDIILCFAAALLIYALLLANPVARVGGSSLGDIIHWRYKSRIVSAIAVMAGLSGVICLLSLAAPVAVRTLAQAGSITPSSARIIVGLLGLAAVLPGGARSVLAVSGVAVAIMATGWGIPAALVVSASGADRWSLLSGAPDVAFGTIEPGLDAIGGCMAALGVVMLVHFPFPAAGRAHGRRGAALAALAVLVIAVVALALTGRSPSTAGAGLRIPTVARALLDLTPALVLTGLFAILLHVSARAVAHDVIYRLAGRMGTASGRMALQRLATIGLAWAALQGLLPSISWTTRDIPTAVVLLLTAAVPGPLLLLGLWRRVDWRAAVCGLVSAALASSAIAAGYVETGAGLAAGALSCLLAGGIAAVIFPSREAVAMAATEVMTGIKAGGMADASA